MSITKKIKALCDERKITFAELEREVGISNGQIRRWESVSPKVENVQKIADYFSVTVDFLLGRTPKKYWELTDRDEQSIQKKMEELIQDMANTDALSFSKDSEPYSEETKQLLIISMENALRMAKQAAKKKYTPKKYRD